MSSKSTRDRYERDDVEFDGSLLDWFAFDRMMMRYARKKLGDTGEALWLGTLTPTIGANRLARRTTILQDILTCMQVNERLDVLQCHTSAAQHYRWCGAILRLNDERHH